MGYCKNVRNRLELSDVQFRTPPFNNLLAAFTIKVKTLWREGFGSASATGVR